VVSPIILSLFKDQGDYLVIDFTAIDELGPAPEQDLVVEED
jgi:hypothetical protein